MSVILNKNIPLNINDLTIVGMAVYFPTCRDLVEFEKIIFGGLSLSRETKSTESQSENNNYTQTGRGFNDLETRIKIELNKTHFNTENLNHQPVENLLLLKVIHDALINTNPSQNILNVNQNCALIFTAGNTYKDANLSNDEHDALGNWLSKLLNLNGPIIASINKATFFKDALVKAQRLLTDNFVDSVIIAASTWREIIKDTALDNGAAAVVLTKYGTALHNEQHVYAVLRDIDHSLKQDEFSGHSIGFLEICNTADNEHQVIPAGSNDKDKMVCAIGSILENIGYAACASEIASLIKASLILYRRTIPPSSQNHLQQSHISLQGTPFYLANEARPWFIGRDDEPRHAMISDCKHHPVLLSEDGYKRVDLPLSSRYHDQYLFPLAENCQEDLMAGLSKLEAAIDSNSDIFKIAQIAFYKFRKNKDAAYCAGIIGSDKADILKEIQYAQKGIPSAFSKGTGWQSPQGSYFTPAPLGSKGEIAFVYSGAFNSYIGFGRKLFYLFPNLYKSMAEISANMGEILHEKNLYPRSIDELKKEQKEELEAELIKDPIAMLSSGTGFALLYTMVMREIFKINPGFGFGYSLGENSMLFAMGIWRQGDKVYNKLKESTLFRTQLTGPQYAVKNYWESNSTGPINESRLKWSNYVLLADPEEVKDVLKDRQYVYLTHINAPRQVVIGGEESACQQVISKLNCMHLKAPYNYAIHCAAMQSEYKNIADLHTWPVEANPDVTLYSAASYSPISFNSSEIANNIATALCSQLDFPRLVKRTYEDGARIFIEIGAGSNCSKWVDAILSDSPHVSIPVNRANCEDQVSILRLLAILISHQVEMDISPLYRE